MPSGIQGKAYEPAATIVQKLGGPSKVAKLVGIHAVRVSNWQRPKAKGGTGGCIPLKHHRIIIEEGRRRGVLITAEDLLPAVELCSPECEKGLTSLSGGNQLISAQGAPE